MRVAFDLFFGMHIFVPVVLLWFLDDTGVNRLSNEWGLVWCATFAIIIVETAWSSGRPSKAFFDSEQFEPRGDVIGGALMCFMLLLFPLYLIAASILTPTHYPDGFALIESIVGGDLSLLQVFFPLFICTGSGFALLSNESEESALSGLRTVICITHFLFATVSLVVVGVVTMVHWAESGPLILVLSVATMAGFVVLFNVARRLWNLMYAYWFGVLATGYSLGLVYLSMTVQSIAAR